jgi:hypothetical protein
MTYSFASYVMKFRQTRRRQAVSLAGQTSRDVLPSSDFSGKKEIMYYSLCRIALLIGAIATLSTACGAPVSTVAPTTKAPIATKAVPTTTKIVPTNTPEPTATQVVLGVVAGRIAFWSDRDGNGEVYVMNGDGSGLANLTNNPIQRGRQTGRRSPLLPTAMAMPKSM